MEGGPDSAKLPAESLRGKVWHVVLGSVRLPGSLHLNVPLTEPTMAKKYWIGGVALGLVAIVGTFGLIRLVVKLQGTELTLYTPPGDETFEVGFPGKPEWINATVEVRDPFGIVRGREKQRLYQYPPDESASECYAVIPSRLWEWGCATSPSDSADDYSERELAERHASQMVSLIKYYEPEKPVDTTTYGFPSIDKLVRVRKSSTTYVFRAVAVSNRTYVMFVKGNDLTLDTPRVQAFFNSFRLKDREAPPELAPRLEDELRPLARIKPFDIAAFAPNLNAFFTLTGYYPGEHPFEPGQVQRVRGTLHRYHYPSFRHEGTFEIDSPGDSGIVVDEKTNTLYVKSQQAPGDYSGKLLAYELPAADAKPEKLTHRAASEQIHHLHGLTLSQNGDFLYGRSMPPRPVRLGAESVLKFETKGLRKTGEAPPNGTFGLSCSTPDRSKLYLLDFEPGRSSILKELDAEGLKFTREVPVAPDPFQMAAGDGIVFAISAPRGSSGDPKRRVMLINLNSTPPTAQRLDATLYPCLMQLSPDGKRLYICSWGYATTKVESWDVHEAVERGQTRVLGSQTLAIKKKNSDRCQGPFISPDGKCAVIGTGDAFWLTGAGPLPAVDESAKP